MNQDLRPRDPLRFLTIAGRIVFLVTLVFSASLFAWIVLYAKDRVPSRSYPVAFVLIPVVIGAAIFFIGVELLLHLLGIRVWVERNDGVVPTVLPPTGAPAGTPRDRVDSTGPK